MMRFSVIAAALTMVSCTAQEPTERSVSDELHSDRPGSEVGQPITARHGFTSGLVDADGVLWFGTKGSGVFRYNGRSFTELTERDGLCSDQVQAVIQDHAGVLWFGTPKGLCRYDRGAFSSIPLPFRDTTGGWLDEVYPVMDPNAVHALAEDKKGDLWIGTAGGGAYRYDRKAFTPYLTDIGTKQTDGRTYNWIPSIEVDAEGQLWFASMSHGGAMRFTEGTFTQFLPKDGLSDDMIRTIYTDRSGNVWFGFNGNRASGLTVYREGTFTTHTAEDGLCDPSIHALFEDSSGKLWIGSGRGSLCVFDGSTFTEFYVANGVPFPAIRFILEDREGAIWVGGGMGLWRIVEGSVETMVEIE
ncbi:MAG: two-component regulator propeller domain-containing protein [Flavobacteriales bacterium]